MNLEYGEITTPISIERIRRIFDTEGWGYELAGSQIQTGFRGMPLVVTYFPEHDRLDFTATIVAESLNREENAILDFIEEWHRTKVVPKAYLHENAEGEKILQLEQILIFSDSQQIAFGATDAQLDHALRNFIFAALAFRDEFFESLGTKN
ncbi:YbjN domain-containing protein [Arcanobacterium hippocoleae]|uniref:Sensory transduction regulator n=1 Tax=Arcanobacterium hippocoleae TaxID=149017 RepID=A0ABU1T324_9ACTO|nr:YbjN domain-containing protein [Arcanobacterium hippocoleae]MDR6939782.1 hypothetical protein [Arcanobacterium hippocoleae]